MNCFFCFMSYALSLFRGVGGPMGYADLHIHSLHSFDGTASISAILKYISTFTDLNILAITDHDTLAGVTEAVELAPKYNLQVIPGCEVSTRDGHVLCLFVDHLIKSGLSLLETVMQAGDQGGLCIAAHPQAKGVKSLHFSTIAETLKNKDAAKLLVGIEAFNAGLIMTRGNPLNQKLAGGFPLAQLGGSDAHLLKMIGQGSIWYEGNTIRELKNAIMNHTTIPRRGHGLSTATVVTSYIPAILLKLLGWVSWNAAPDAPIRLTNWMKVRMMKTTIESF
ncbi:PHP domain-containing protein [bacterium]|nr:PHP domain-containing protein [bacterium]